MHTLRFAFLGLFLLTPLLTAADWDRFRGPEGLGTATDKNVPVDFSPATALWKTTLPGKGNSSPIVSKGKIFLQSASEDRTKRMFFCVDAASGKIDWTRDVKGASGTIHRKNSMASCSAAADGERVYIVFWDGDEISFTGWDYAGKMLWRKELGKFKSQHGPGLSPMILGNQVYLNVDQDDLAEVIAFDTKTGDIAWKKSRTAFRASYTTPFVLERDGKKEVVVGSTAGITSYDPKDGSIIWNWTWDWKAAPKGKRKEGGALRNVGGPIFHEGMLFAISGDGNSDRLMVALKAGKTGEVTNSAISWEMTKGTPYVPMVLAAGEHLYWISDLENKALCAEAKTGKVIWEERLPGAGEVSASPVMVDGKIYSIHERGRVSVFEAKPKFKLLADNDLKEDVYASPAVADGRLYIRGVNTLFCFGKK